MSGVTAIRQRKQWTADLDTLTEGHAVWTLGSGTPDGTGIAWSSTINVSGTTVPGGGGNHVAQWTIEWEDVQQPRYTNLSATFNLTYTVASGRPGSWLVEIFQGSPTEGASASGTGGSISATIGMDLVPSPEPTYYLAFFALGDGDTVNTTVSGTITLTWS